MSKKKITFHADDLGMTLGANRGIKEAYDFGILTSTSIMTNGAAFDDAIHSVVNKCKALKVGLHLNISENPEISGKLFGDKTKVIKSPIYRGFISTFIKSFKKSFMICLEEEIRSQFEKANSSLANIDHVNSHEHFCAIPRVFDLVCKLCIEYNIKKIRIVNEPFYVDFKILQKNNFSILSNLVKWVVLRSFSFFNKTSAKKYNLNFSECFIGTLLSNKMSESNCKLILNKIIPKYNDIEVLLHPAKYVSSTQQIYFSAKMRDYCLSQSRIEELNTLTSSKFHEYLSQHYKVKTLTQNKQNNSNPHRVFCIFDEEEFFHPNLLDKLNSQDEQINVVGLAIVKFKRGSVLKRYFLKYIFYLGIFQSFNLLAKSTLLKLFTVLSRLLGGKAYSSCESWAFLNKISYKKVNSLKGCEFSEWVSLHEPDYIISSNSLILDENLLKIPKIKSLNRHSSLLPSNKGILPIFRSIEHGQGFAGVTIHEMTNSIDEGAILSQFAFPVYKEDTVFRLYKTCFELSFPLILEAITTKTAKKSISPYPSSYHSFPTKQDWKTFNSKKIWFV